MAEIPRQEETGKNTEEIKIETPPILEPTEAGKKDREELGKFMAETQSDILLKMLNGDSDERLGVDDVRRHDEEFAPKKIKDIEEDSERLVKKMPEMLAEIINDPNSYETYLDFLKSQGREGEAVGKEEHKKILQQLKAGLEKHDPKIESQVKDRYQEQRIKAMMGIEEKDNEKEGEPVEDPYREIEKRLLKAKKKLEQEGLDEDAKNLEQTIARMQSQMYRGEKPDMLLWDKETDQYKKEKPKGIMKWILGRDYAEPVREAGGTIIRANGTREKFFTYTRFKKAGEKTHTKNLGGDDYHYILEPQPGDQVVSWEPSERGEKIIMDALGNSSKPKNEGGNTSGYGDSGIEYWSSEFNTSRVQIANRRENYIGKVRQTDSYAMLQIDSPPQKPYKEE